MSTLTPEQLVQHWYAVEEGAGQAIDWIQSTRENAPRLDAEADSLIYKLRRSRNKARSLAQAAEKPMTIGFFGLSQAGKSYLISALAADDNGRLETCLGGKRLDFLSHINPPGGGKEATGLVTRFSRQAVTRDERYPVELQLFSEVEIGKILANAFIHDFNQEKIDWQYDEAAVAGRLQQLSSCKRATPVAGVTSDDVVSLWDYLVHHAENSQKKLAASFWPTAVALAPWLEIEDRARLFSILWGDIPELTEAYGRLARTLQRLSGAQTVLAPLQALVQQQGMLVQTDSIINVDMLERLNTASDSQITVCPYLAGQGLPPVALSLAELTVLTAELVIPLSESSKEPLFNQVNLLDFPGYRGRLGVESMDGVRHAVNGDEANPLAQLILRGKVAYLFERYTDNQEMNVLVLCTASDKQSDVRDVGGVLDEWIRHTQGVDAESRQKRPCGLVWALTRFDLRVGQSLSLGESLLRQSWGDGGMIKMAMTERFGQYPWMQQWLPGQAFNNTFLVRKPCQQPSFLQLRDNSEIGVREENCDQLRLVRQTFIEDDAVCRHIDQPEAAWEAMMTLNDGGMRRMADYLSRVAQRDMKLQRIAEQLDDVRYELVENRLANWYQQEGEQAFTHKQRIASDILRVLQARTAVHGELLESLLPARRDLLDLYMQEWVLAPAVDDPVSASESIPETYTTAHLGVGLDVDLFGDTDSGASVVIDPVAAPFSHREKNRQENHETVFARRAIQFWINYLRTLPENRELIEQLAVPQQIMAFLIDELITAGQRMRLEDQLVSQLVNTAQAGVRREKMADRQVTRVLRLLGDFTTWLGFLSLPEGKRPPSRANPGYAIFARPERQPLSWGNDERLFRLPAQPVSYTAFFIYDWLVGLREVIVENAGHSAGREISASQNERLGDIIRLIKPPISE
ncbi:putative virulence factor [Dickeya solani]|uniref:Virulence factor SrfC family protein n=1 Tax=Dickeya solani TaxID=1089444 RepID=A0ABU4ENK5_9GAMM|nr:virulence factor SrfC family protein [Dickeya solani]MCA6999743.1 putative virulence factor [Dickeya solani]MCZ0820312.1 virulence factor SrfC family protein [Dickeya solani]MDV6993954.1 virulence factor SrfC family protein [Dickeya solani]MDV7005310.1 virulence factor SrfC family protein [Dickeya solani]MDV7039127.1 virulence factor SrfC family protein [Dickeya solani]